MGTESTSAKASAVDVDREPDHFIGGIRLFLYLGCGEDGCKAGPNGMSSSHLRHGEG